MSDGPTRYYLYIPVWATGRAPQGGGSSNYSTPSGSTPESTYSTPTSTPSMPPSYSTTGDVIYTTGPGGTPTLTFYTTGAFTSNTPGTTHTPSSSGPSDRAVEHARGRRRRVRMSSEHGLSGMSSSGGGSSSA
jgi:hypothetical protein